jgi:hypothetical protein
MKARKSSMETPSPDAAPSPGASHAWRPLPHRPSPIPRQVAARILEVFAIAVEPKFIFFIRWIGQRPDIPHGAVVLIILAKRKVGDIVAIERRAVALGLSCCRGASSSVTDAQQVSPSSTAAIKGDIAKRVK